MTPSRPGWPAHRPRCTQRDAAVVRSSTTVGQARWLLRRCSECGEVGLELVADQVPTGGDAA